MSPWTLVWPVADKKREHRCVWKRSFPSLTLVVLRAGITLIACGHCGNGLFLGVKDCVIRKDHEGSMLWKWPSLSDQSPIWYSIQYYKLYYIFMTKRHQCMEGSTASIHAWDIYDMLSWFSEHPLPTPPEPRPGNRPTSTQHWELGRSATKVVTFFVLVTLTVLVMRLYSVICT